VRSRNQGGLRLAPIDEVQLANELYVIRFALGSGGQLEVWLAGDDESLLPGIVQRNGRRRRPGRRPWLLPMSHEIQPHPDWRAALPAPASGRGSNFTVCGV
jgi:hypothetical protein